MGPTRNALGKGLGSMCLNPWLKVPEPMYGGGDAVPAMKLLLEAMRQQLWTSLPLAFAAAIIEEEAALTSSKNSTSNARTRVRTIRYVSRQSPSSTCSFFLTMP